MCKITRGWGFCSQLLLTGKHSQAIHRTNMAGRSRTVLAILLALAVFAILVSPVVASWPGVLRCRQSAHAAFFAIMMGGMHFDGQIAAGSPMPATAPTWSRTVPDLLALNTARLC